MGPWIASALLALLFAGWAYRMLYRSSGGNTKNAATGSGIIWFIAFLILGSLLRLIM